MDEKINELVDELKQIRQGMFVLITLIGVIAAVLIVPLLLDWRVRIISTIFD